MSQYSLIISISVHFELEWIWTSISCKVHSRVWVDCQIHFLVYSSQIQRCFFPEHPICKIFSFSSAVLHNSKSTVKAAESHLSVGYGNSAMTASLKQKTVCFQNRSTFSLYFLLRYMEDWLRYSAPKHTTSILLWRWKRIPLKGQFKITDMFFKKAIHASI